MSADLVCAVDVGTSGVKVAVLGPDGTLHGRARRNCMVHYLNGHAEQSINDVWEAMTSAIAEAIADVASRIAAVTVSSQRATFVALDGNDRPLTEWISWQDHRGASYCTQLRDDIGDDSIYRITGLALDPTAPISKIMWMAKHQRQIFDDTVTFASHQAFILRQFGAESLVSGYSDASYMGTFDVSRLAWSEPICRSIGVEADRFGRVVDSGTVVGEVSESTSRATGLGRNTALVVGGGDLQCGSLGVGADRPGVLTVGLGTGGHCVSFLPSPAFHAKRAVNCQAHVVPGAWELEGIALSTASTLQWTADHLGEADASDAGRRGRDRFEILVERAALSPAGADGLLALPMLNGAGAPHARPEFRGTVLGLNLTHDKGSLVRAFFEGICFELRSIYESMAEVGVDVTEIRAWGGPSKSAFITQMLADVFARPVTPAATADAGLVGAAIIGAAAMGLHSSIPDATAAMVRPGQVRLPLAENATVYSDCYARYLVAVSDLLESDVYEHLAELRGSQQTR